MSLSSSFIPTRALLFDTKKIELRSLKQLFVVYLQIYLVFKNYLSSSCLPFDFAFSLTYKDDFKVLTQFCLYMKMVGLHSQGDGDAFVHFSRTKNLFILGLK